MLKKKLLIAATAAAMLPAMVAMDTPYTPLPGEHSRLIRHQLKQRSHHVNFIAPEEAVIEEKPLVQLAILLDTSNSMDGLIDQAKTHLWQIVNEFATAKQNGQSPDLHVALFEYGNDGLPAEENHIRLVVPLTNDLDKISEELFALRTNGGSEYCGAVIDKATEVLTWSSNNDDFKAIFIAGNEPFTQGPKLYTESCKAAIEKGIIVNTIFCGDQNEGINTKWKDGAVLADGAYVSINQNARLVHIEAPQDKEIAQLNTQLNGTYIAYGLRGVEAKERQQAQDDNAADLNDAVLAQRAASKSSKLYSNAKWDLCDAWTQGKIKIEDLEKIPADQLPEEMRKMNKEERKQYVLEKIQERKKIQDKIKKLSAERQRYVAEERKKQAEASGEKTLEDAVIESVRDQAGEKGFEFEEEPPVEEAPEDTVEETAEAPTEE